mmetsp:Transcript_27668/g.54293  ORF Transcript_27668/g.54293 Transcript_27668/m.54293 type:complete len:98 (+) Transcript_27668:51-344(+)
MGAACAGQNKFDVTLQRTEDATSLGIEVDLKGGNNAYIKIDAITGGLFGDWNKDHPDKEIKVEDRIVAVNGVKDDAAAMIEVCKKADKLELQIHRPY